MSDKLYAERDYQGQGEHYFKHVGAMTSEDLRAKSEIAGELAHRDIEIERLTAINAELLEALKLTKNITDDISGGWAKRVNDEARAAIAKGRAKP